MRPMSATRPDDWNWFVEEWARLDREHMALAAEAARLEHSRDVAALDHSPGRWLVTARN